jgi:YD repeat-containing protein
VRLVVLALLAACEPPSAEPTEPPDAARAAPIDPRDDARAAVFRPGVERICVVEEETWRGVSTWTHRVDGLGRVVSTLQEHVERGAAMRSWSRSPGRVVVHTTHQTDAGWLSTEPIYETWERGRIVRRDPPGKAWTTWTWDDEGRLVEYRDHLDTDGDVIHRSAYDERGRLTLAEGEFTGDGPSIDTRTWTWDGDLLVVSERRHRNVYDGWVAQTTWTDHDDTGRPLVGATTHRQFAEDGSASDDTYAEEWRWDGQGRATAHLYPDGDHSFGWTWTWGDHDVEEVLTRSGEEHTSRELYAWDDAGRVISWERSWGGETGWEWDWAADGSLTEARGFSEGSVHSVYRWSGDCPSWTWLTVEIPDPGPWPTPPTPVYPVDSLIPGPGMPLLP